MESGATLGRDRGNIFFPVKVDMSEINDFVNNSNEEAQRNAVIDLNIVTNSGDNIETNTSAANFLNQSIPGTSFPAANQTHAVEVSNTTFPPSSAFTQSPDILISVYNISGNYSMRNESFIGYVVNKIEWFDDPILVFESRYDQMMILAVLLSVYISCLFCRLIGTCCDCFCVRNLDGDQNYLPLEMDDDDDNELLSNDLDSLPEDECAFGALELGDDH